MIEFIFGFIINVILIFGFLFWFLGIFDFLVNDFGCVFLRDIFV